MSVEELLSPFQLRGLPYEVAKLYGMPHVGCGYYRDDIAATTLASDFPRCAACGRTDGFHSVHHEPPRSKGSFKLDTPLGQFVLLPALIDLCGSGTTGCHGERHSGLLAIRWEWDCPEYEREWWNGHLLSRIGGKPNGRWLWDYGRYVFERGGKATTYREVS